MATLQQQHGTIDREIVSELISLVPEEWNCALLTIERLDQPDGERLRLVIDSPERRQEVVGASDELSQLAFDLHDVFRRAASKVWRKVIYRLDRDGEDWTYRAEFEY
jgi:hypothetical protein